MLSLQFLTVASGAIASTNTSYFQPNSTGIKLQNGFERVYIQVCTYGFPHNNLVTDIPSLLVIMESAFEQAC